MSFMKEFFDAQSSFFSVSFTYLFPSVNTKGQAEIGIWQALPQHVLLKATSTPATV